MSHLAKAVERFKNLNFTSVFKINNIINTSKLDYDRFIWRCIKQVVNYLPKEETLFFTKH